MHESIDRFLAHLQDRGRSPLTVKATRADLLGFVTWWERTRQRAFDPILLRPQDIQTWQHTRQVEDGAAPTTINRAMVSLRSYCAWAQQQSLLYENPVTEIKAIPKLPPVPKSLPPEAVDAVLRAVRAEKDERLRLRDEALLALLVYAGLRAQESCDVQLRDLDLAGGTVTVRHGKGGRMRRVQLTSDAISMLRRYLTRLRIPQGMPGLGSDAEREALLVGFDHTSPGFPMRPGINQRQVQRVVIQRAHEAAARLRSDAKSVASLERVGQMLEMAQQLEQTTPHTLRHSLARRLLASGADLAIVQRTLGHSSIATTGMYVTPSDEDVREAMERAKV